MSWRLDLATLLTNSRPSSKRHGNAYRKRLPRHSSVLRVSEQNDKGGAARRARLIELPSYRRDDGEVVVAEITAQVPFASYRLFTLTAPVGAHRGKHAHRLCSQFMLCVAGAVEVVCDDGY